MFHEDIMSISNRKYIKTSFLFSNMHAKHFIWTTLKMIFLQPQILDFQIVVSRPNIRS